MEHALFLDRIATLTTGFTPVIDSTYTASDYRFLDLSFTNKILEEVDTSSAQAIQHYINTYLAKTGGRVAYGGYLEQRSIYDRSLYFHNDNPDLKRNIHLGIDVWSAEGTPVLAPVAGSVHSFKDNTNYGDYGPCVVLEHHFEDLHFYTLYGHLSRTSLESLKVGEAIAAGQTIAHLGTPDENGDYGPHLHFQLIKELQGNHGDYPGVSTLKNLDFYKANCPDPNLLLKVN